MQRTTIKTLRWLVDILNDQCGMPRSPWVRDEAGNNRSIEGCYVLDCAYGGYRLAQIVGTTGGERNITPRYGAAVAADLILAYMDGLRDGKSPRYISPSDPAFGGKIDLDPAA